MELVAWPEAAAALFAGPGFSLSLSYFKGWFPICRPEILMSVVLRFAYYAAG